MGFVAARILGPRERGVPACVNINDGGLGFHGAAFLGIAYNPFRTGIHSYGNEGVQLPSANALSFNPVDGLNAERILRQASLLEGLDTIRRGVVVAGGTEY